MKTAKILGNAAEIHEHFFGKPAKSRFCANLLRLTLPAPRLARTFRKRAPLAWIIWTSRRLSQIDPLSGRQPYPWMPIRWVSDNGGGKQKHAIVAEGRLGTGIVAALARQRRRPHSLVDCRWCLRRAFAPVPNHLACRHPGDQRLRPDSERQIFPDF